MWPFSRSPPAPAPESPPESPPAPAQHAVLPPLPEKVVPPPRPLNITEPRKPLIMFFVGGAFLVLSTRLAKMAVMRRWTASKPKYYQPNTEPNKVKGIIEAVEALQIATLNVMSGAIMCTGGTFWALQISNMQQLRDRLGVHKPSEEELEDARENPESKDTKDRATEKR